MTRWQRLFPFLRWPRPRFDAWSGLIAASIALTALPAWAQQPANQPQDVTLEAGKLPGKAQNTPFDGRALEGKVIGTWKAGRRVFG